MDDRNLGKFKISVSKIRRNPYEVFEIFKLLKMVVVEAYTEFATNTINYTGISERFEKVIEGEIVPEYQLNIEIDSTGHVCCVETVKLRG
jgi:hypothetical protein